MKTLVRCLMLVTALCVAWATNAQTLGDYVYSTGTDASKWITLTDSTNLMGTGNADGRASSVQNIGFAFPFGEGSYTQFSVNSDGNLRLGSTVTGTGSYGTPFSSSASNTNSPKINFFGCDGYYLDTIHYVYAENTVDANNDSLLVVEFNLGTYTTTTRAQHYKWQVQLYPNGNIVVVYAPTAPAQAPAVAHQKGMCFNVSNGVVITPDNQVHYYTNGSSLNWESGTWPAPNTYYSFSRSAITCTMPSAISVHAVGTTTATLSFTPTGSASVWIASINPPIMGMSSYPTTDTSATLMFLTPNTEYTVCVRSLCGPGDTSVAQYTTFRTLCNSLTAADLPYTEDFEAYGSGSSNPISTCWTKGTNNSTAYPYPFATNAITGSRSLYFYSYKPSSATSTSYYCYAALPQLDASVDITGLTLRFNSRRYSTTTSTYRSLIQVGVMTDPTDLSTFELVQLVNMTSLPSLTIQSNEINFASYTGTGKYIAFYSPVIDTTSYAYNYIYIDDVELLFTPTCIRPTGVTVSNLTSSTATVSWTPASSEQNTFVVAYGTGTDPTAMTQVTVSGTSLTLSGLNQSTEYNVYVKAVCDANDQSDFSSPASFTTLCGPTPLPFSEDFDNLSSNLPNCWTKVGSGTVAKYSSTTYSHSGSYSLKFNGSTSNLVLLPEFDAPTNTLTMSAWMRPESFTNSSCGTFSVGYVTDPTDASSFVAVETYSYNDFSTVENRVIDFASVPANAQIAMRHNANSTAWYWFVDDIEVSVATPSCVATTWTSGDSTGNSYYTPVNNYYKYTLSETIITAEEIGGPMLIDTLSYHYMYSSPMTDKFDVTIWLQPTTKSVFANSSDIDLLDTTVAVQIFHDSMNFSQGWNDIALPTPYLFDGNSNLMIIVDDNSGDYNSNSHKFSTAACTGYKTITWYSDSQNPDPLTGNNSVNETAFSGTKTYYQYRVRMALKGCDLSTCHKPTDLAVTNVTATSATLNWTDNNSGATYTVLNMVNNSIAQTGISGGSATISGLVPQTSYAFGVYANCSDDDSSFVATITFSTPATCVAPSNFTSSNVTATSATLTWVDNTNTGATYTIYDMSDTSVVATGLTGTSYTISGLTANTSYSFGIIANCSAEDNSSMSTFTLTTPCESLNIPYFEDFDNLSNNLPDCWVKVGSGTAAKYSSSTYAHSGSYSLKFNGSTSNLVVLPPMDTTTNALQMTLWTRPESFSNTSCGTFSVGYVTNVSDASSFVAVETYSYDDFSAVELRTVNYNNAPANARLALRHNANSTTWYWFVDDIDVHLIPSCVAPTGVAATLLSTTSVNVTWNADMSVSNYVVAYGTGTDPDLMPTINTTTNSATITGLTPESLYNIYVKTVCSTTDESSWSTPASINTGYCLPNPTSMDGDGITNVTFGSGTEVVNNSTLLSTAPFYGNFHTMVGGVPAGGMANVSITYETGYTYGTIIWVDWDNSLTFDDDEVVFAGTSASDNPTTLNAGFMVPATQDTGIYRMRIVGADSYFDSYTSSISAAANADPCFSSTWSVAHDYSLHVLPPASCNSPYNVTVSTTSSSATVSWSVSGTESNFVVMYTSDSLTFDSVTVSGATTATLTGLTANTIYAVAVKTVCGATNESDWSTVAYFQTDCGAVTVTATNPFYETFELTSPTLSCWHTNGTKWGINANSLNGSFLAYSGISAFADGSGSGEDILVSPILDLSGITSATLSFMYINPEWYGDQNELAVLYRNSRAAAWDTLTVLDTDVTTWTNVTLNLPTISSSTQVAFYFTDNYGYCVGLDSVIVAPVRPSVTLNIATDNATMGTIIPAPGTYTYYVGDSISATAVANTGYHFTYWIMSLGVLTDTIPFISYSGMVPAFVAGSTFNLTAYFAADQHTVTATANNPIMGTVTGSGTYSHGSTATLTAVPATNTHFVQWNDGDTNATRTIVVTSDTTFTATFAFNPVTVTLINANPTMGTTNPVPGTYTFNLGDSIGAFATANTGYHFAYWALNMAGATDTIMDNPIGEVIPNLPMFAGMNFTVTANFAPDQYTLTVASNDNTLGTVTGTGTYNYLDTVTITATPATHCLFVQWNDGNTNAVRDVVVTGDATYTATFQAEPQYEVTFIVVPDNGGTVSGAGLYYAGESVTIIANPNNGYHFVGWAYEGTVDPFDYFIFSHEQTYTFSMTEQNQHIYALFAEDAEPVSVTVTINNPDWGHVLINGVQTNTVTVNVGDNIVLEAVAADGFHFDRWEGVPTVNDTIPGPVCSFTVTEAININCFFAENVGINDVVEDNIVIYSENSSIMVRGAEQQTIRVFDVVGRMVAQRNATAIEETIQMPSTGVYLVQIGNRPARRVVVRK